MFPQGMKNIMILTMIYVICLSNKIIADNYMSEYMPEYFDRHKLIEPKNRCIRYFNANHFNKYSNAKCSEYQIDYVLFKLEKSYNIFTILLYNLIVNSTIIVLWIIT